MDMIESKKNLEKALELLWEKSRFTSYFYQSVQFTEDEGIPTIGLTASGFRPVIIYNNDFISSRPAEELVGLLVHELLHIVFDHSHRAMAGQDLYLQNHCQDMTVNSYIIDQGSLFFSGSKMSNDPARKIRLPAGAPVIPDSFFRETGNTDPVWEEVFEWITTRGPERLIEFIEEVRKNLAPEKKDHVPVSSPDQPVNPSNELFDIREDKKALVFNSPGGGATAAGVHFMDDENSRRHLKASLKRIIRFADNIREFRNDRIYQDIRRLIGSPVSTDTSFSRKIRSIIDRTAPSNKWKYSSSRLSRRYADSGIYSPGRVFKEKERIIVAIDVSASMTITPKEIEAAFGAMEGLLDKYRIHLLCIDETLFIPRRDGLRETAPGGEEKAFVYKKGDWRIIKTGSSGTTLFAPLFNSFLKNRKEMVVVITDGYIYDIDLLNPHEKTLWLVSGNRTEPFRPHFGQVEAIKIKNRG